MTDTEMMKLAPPWRRKADPPDWDDLDSVATWIEHTRSNAFFAGARGDQISRVEAALLIEALKSHISGDGL